MSALYSRIYLVVRQIPPGRVATYGQIADIVREGCDARVVGYALAALHDTREMENVPWQRVINARGEISARGREAEALRQREMLEEEGVVFDAEGRTDLARFGWEGPNPEWLLANGFSALPVKPKTTQPKLF